MNPKLEEYLVIGLWEEHGFLGSRGFNPTGKVEHGNFAMRKKIEKFLKMEFKFLTAPNQILLIKNDEVIIHWGY